MPQSPPPVADAAMFFLSPGRITRPRQIVLILRGLPGAGKSRLARIVRELEKEEGFALGVRVLCLDDCFDLRCVCI
jgi:YLP motif-containing protein 1